MGDLMRPPPRRSLGEHAVAVLRWIGIGRLAAIAASVLAVAAGAVWLLRPPESARSDRAVPSATVPPPTMPGGPGESGATPASADPPDAPSTSVAPTSAPDVVVHVAGAVAAPGVYVLGPSSRVGDAVTAAGGAAPGAALDAVNLAAPLADGQQVYVPLATEASGPAPRGTAPPSAGSVPATPAGPIDLNTATEQQLLDLPGVGPVLAAAIVRHREEAGPFTSVDGLLDVSGIGPARLESLRDLVRV